MITSNQRERPPGKRVASSRTTARRWRIGLAASLVVAVLLGIAAIHQPYPAAQGNRLLGQPIAATEGESLRVGAFNIHGGRDAQGNYDLDRTADCLRGLDLVGLNEVHGAFPWQAGDQAELLGRRLDMAWLFAPTTWRWFHDDFGNGIVCSLPVAAWRREPLSGTQWKKYRNTLLVQLPWQDQVVQALVTHIDRVRDREMQLREVFAKFLSLPEPCILMGDLNSTADDPQVKRLLATRGVHDAIAEGMQSILPSRIDWILTRGMHAVDAGIMDTGASDHPFVWAELKLDDKKRLITRSP